MNIVLTGFMASGKTTISRILAKMLDYKLCDTDEMIIELAQMSINDIFAKYGEGRFREFEAEIIQKAAAFDKAVISTGGGTVLNLQNMNELRKNGVIINLAPDFDVIKSRIEKAANTRPLLKGQSIADIEKRFNDRRPFYDDCDFKIHITSEKSPKSCACEIINILKEGQKL